MPDISNITLPDGNTYNLIDATVPHTSETAASGGTALSLVTTGEKYIWNSSSALSGLSDVAITSLTNDEILQYNSTSGKWENKDAKADRVPLPAEYTPTSTYLMGNFCIYNGDIYQCTATTTTGTWDSSAWVLCNPQQDYLHSINPNGNGSFSLNRKSGTTVGAYSFAEGRWTTASGYSSHAEGDSTTASGQRSHAEGYNTIANRSGTHAEGLTTTASGDASHAEGDNTTASGQCSHVEGHQTTASEQFSHAEGYATTASGKGSHAEGLTTTASGEGSHAEGANTTAEGKYSHAEGFITISNHKSQHVFGEYNIADASVAASDARGDYVEIVGNGTGSNARSNARTLDWSGNEVLAGKLTATAINTGSGDVTLSSKAATSGGTDLSLVTTGEKYTWNNNSSLAGLSDVTLTTPTNNDVLKYDSTNNVWVNSNSITVDSISATSLNGVTIGSTPKFTDTTYSAGTGLSLSSGTFSVNFGTTSTTASAGNHTHGSITNGGAITGTTALASGDGIIFADSSDSSILKRSSITFDGSTSTKCLTQAGTWATFGTSNLAIGTTASTAAAGNHTHGSITNAGAITGTTALASGDGIIFADSSDSSKLKRSSITFDGSTATQCLTKKGTWASFTNNAGTVTGSGTNGYFAKWNSGSSITNGPVYSRVTSFTTARCSVIAGGYMQIGNVVFVDIHIKFTAATTATQVILGTFPEEQVANVSLVGMVDGSYQESVYGFRINAKNLYANGSRSNGGQWHIFGSYIAK